MNEPELKPCAHCGGADVKLREYDGNPFQSSYYVQCQSQDCYVHTALCGKAEKAINIWNRRYDK